MWHYLFFMILVCTQKSKKDVRAAVQKWEAEQGATFLLDSGLHLICLLLQCLVSPKGDFFSFPSLPDGNWCNCLLNHLLQEPRSFLWLQHTKSSDQQSLAWDSQGKCHKLLLKGLWKVNGKTSLPSAGLNLLLWGPHCHWTVFYREFTDPEWKVGNYWHTNTRCSRQKLFFGIPSSALQLRGPEWWGVTGISQNFCLPFRSYLDVLQMCAHMGTGWAGEMGYRNCSLTWG